MKKLAVAALLFGSPALAAVTPLYTPDSLPTDQGWATLSLGGTGTATLLPLASGGGVQLDTTANAAIQSGYARGTPALNGNTGFTLTFTSAVSSETHSSPVRAGFSVLLLTSNMSGIELGFQGNSIFSQTPGFTAAGETASFDTSALTDYSVVVANNGYTLLANGSSLMSGPLRTYAGTSTSPLAAVYGQADFLFVGDDTTSAAGTFRLTAVAVSVPEAAAIFPVALAGLMLLRRR